MHIKDIYDKARENFPEEIGLEFWIASIPHSVFDKINSTQFAFKLSGIEQSFVLYWNEHDNMITKRLEVFMDGSKYLTGEYIKYVNNVNQCQVPVIEVGVSFCFESTWNFIFDTYPPLAQIPLEVEDEE